MSNNLIIFGTGGLSKEIYYMLINQSKYDKVYFYNNIDKIDEFLDCPVLNNLDYFYKSFALIAVNNPFLRKKFYDNYKEYLFFDYFISKNAIVHNPNIDDGSIITDNNIICSDVIIKQNNYINLNCSIGSETFIGNNNFIAPKVCLSGRVNIGSNCYIGANSFIRQDISICDNVIIGSCSNVTKDIKKAGVYYGNPAKFIKENKFDYKSNMG